MANCVTGDRHCPVIGKRFLLKSQASIPLCLQQHRIYASSISTPNNLSHKFSRGLRF